VFTTGVKKLLRLTKSWCTSLFVRSASQQDREFDPTSRWSWKPGLKESQRRSLQRNKSHLKEKLMGLMDSMKNAATEKLASQNPLVSHLLSMFGGGNQTQGLSGLISSFQQNGLGGVVNSWVGGGENQPISPDQVEQGLGQERIQQISGKLGMDPGTVKTKLAEVLPGAVDKMTPNGKVEQEAA
jgi:uncharacterized protein YidB (DUF937 family)